jgi:pimeloyl-ACP methyl ester carboxylesterase
MNKILGVLSLASLCVMIPPASAQTDRACADLAGNSIPASAIGLSTTGATVTSAADTSTVANGSFCKVQGAIHPVDPLAPDIRFQLNLPANWNGKALQMGGGGYDGRLVTGEDSRFPDPKMPLPLAQGYATFGSDSGHETKPGQDMAAFAANAEALRNFGGDQLKKTHDVAVFLIRQHYGRAPRRMYFQGNSQGGHEGFEVVQRYPADYDGVIAIHPVYDFAALQLDGVLLGQALYNKPGAWVSPDEAALVTKAEIDACDGLDGVKDGIISNIAACRDTFHIDSLRCARGGDSGPACLSKMQIATYKNFAAPMLFTVALSGLNHFAGWPVLDGADLNGRANTFGVEPTPSIPSTPKGSFLYLMGDAMTRNMVVHDPMSNSLEFDQNRNAGQLAEVSRIIDGSSDDIEAFQKRGGKLLIMHGTIDMAVSPYNTVEYYERLEKRFGETALKKFVRFYMAPGFGHGYGSFIVGWDSLGALDAWVEHGTAPGHQVATDTSPEGRGRQRPLCEYPAWPKYEGSGDINAAASFTCEVK